MTVSEAHAVARELRLLLSNHQRALCKSHFSGCYYNEWRLVKSVLAGVVASCMIVHGLAPTYLVFLI